MLQYLILALSLQVLRMDVPRPASGNLTPPPGIKPGTPPVGPFIFDLDGLHVPSDKERLGDDLHVDFK